MAFTPVNIPVQEILETDFVVDLRVASNANALLLKDSIEDLINNLEIDVNTLSIGTDNPINYLRTDSIIIEDTGFVFQTGFPAQIIGSLIKNGSNQSILNVDILTVDSTFQADALTSNSVVVADSLTSNGILTLNAPLDVQSSVSESRESITAVLSDNVGVAEATVTLTSTSRQNIYLTLDADTSVYTGGGLVGAITDIRVIIDFDATNPPVQNTEFTVCLVNIKEQGQLPTTSIISDINTASLPFTIEAGINQSTGNPIILHSGTTALDITTGSLAEYNSLASFLYILDINTDDRLMINSTVNMNLS
jgi:hypothetical protein